MKDVRTKTTESSTIPRDLIAKRAFDKWQLRGCPLWDDERDWFTALSELEAEARDIPRPKGIDRVA